MKLFLSFVTVFVLAAAALSQATAQTADSVIAQITSSSTGSSYPGGISRNGRLVVIESTGDIATEKTPHVRDASGNIVTRGRNNEDGNREIFLFDYAQRRIFQLTVTEGLLKTTTATPTPTPAATPTPAPSPTPVPVTSLQIEISSNKPVISGDGKWIAFSSNAINPASFNANEPANQTALGTTDANQEIFLYRVPDVADVDLSAGQEVPRVNLDAGTFTRLTDTAASRPPTAGNFDSTTGATTTPFVAFDNIDTDVSDDGSIIAFVSTRNLTVANGLTNADANAEIYIYNRTNNSLSQLTNTEGRQVFNSNPSLSGDGTAVAFTSNANIADSAGASNNADGNAEIYFANFGNQTVSNLRQVTRTAQTTGISVNIFSPGRRLSPRGDFIAFESYADLAGGGAVQTTPGLYLYDVIRNSFTLVGPRATTSDPALLRFPTFSGDSATLVFVSSLNFSANGTVPGTAADGLNPGRNSQIFTTPVAAPTAFTRLTNVSALTTGAIPIELQPVVGNTAQRMSFASRAELGGGNPEITTFETNYLLRPAAVSETPASANAVAYLTGASQREVVAPSVTPTPPAVAGLAPGMITIGRSSTVPLAPSARSATGGPELRRPHLPIELNGVSVSINGAAAGLYFVGSNDINFVVPIGLAATTGTQTYPVVINNNGAVIRSTVQITSVQPDIFTGANGAGGRAAVLNITDPSSTGTAEPFTATTTYTGSDGVVKTEATLLRISLTGVRNASRTAITVRIGETDITGDAIVSVTPMQTPGFDQIDVRLPASLAAAGDVAIIVTISGAASRPADSAPRIQIN